MSQPPVLQESSLGAPSSGRHVLIVDDDVSCLVALEQIVAYWGHTTISFRSFEKARAYLADHQTPDAAIIDVRLGDYNGLQLVHLVRQASPETLLISVSGFDDPVLREEASRLGAAYMTKPVNLAELRDHLAKLAPRAAASPDR
jgi:DNA-binding response OmpR family regulator